MTTWTVLNIIILATIFWLNAVIAATPYVAYLAERHATSSRSSRLATALVLALLSAAYFFLSVGSFAGAGIAGMFDITYMQFVWVGPIGTFVELQAFAAAIWLVYALAQSRVIQRIAYVLAIVFMVGSFFSMGHGADAAWWGKAALLTHLFIAWLWFGSLNALRKLGIRVPIVQAKQVMQRFGTHMAFAVPLLLFAGATLYRSATGHWLPQFPLMSYDIALLSKLSLVTIILLLAALHKFALVPQLKDQASAQRLSRSITVEMAVAAAIFIAAATLSSAFSPA